MATLQGQNNSPLVLAPTDRQSYWLAAGENTSFVATGKDTGGQFSLFDFFLPPQAGPSPHIHSNEDEAFYVLQGNLSLQMHDETLTAPAGSFVYLPKNHVHGFRNLDSTPVRFLDIALPSGIENLFQKLGVPGSSTSLPPSPTLDSAFLEQVMATSSQYGLNLTDSLLLFNAPEYSNNNPVAPIIVARTGSDETAVSATLTANYSQDNSTIKTPVTLGSGERLKTVPIPITNNGSATGNQTIKVALTDISSNLTPALLYDNALLNIVDPNASNSMSSMTGDSSHTMTGGYQGDDSSMLLGNSSRQSFSLGSENFSVIATGADTEGQFSLFDVLVPPQTNAEPFIYGQNEEAYYILDGNVSFQLPDQTITASSGSFVFLPKGNQYALSNQGTNPARALLVSPGALFKPISIPESSFTWGLLGLFAWGVVSLMMKNKLQKQQSSH